MYDEDGDEVVAAGCWMLDGCYWLTVGLQVIVARLPYQPNNGWICKAPPAVPRSSFNLPTPPQPLIPHSAIHIDIFTTKGPRFLVSAVPSLFGVVFWFGFSSHKFPVCACTLCIYRCHLSAVQKGKNEKRNMKTGRKKNSFPWAKHIVIASTLPPFNFPPNLSLSIIFQFSFPLKHSQKRNMLSEF